mgnify:CR=1 FL=1
MILLRFLIVSLACCAFTLVSPLPTQAGVEYPADIAKVMPQYPGSEIVQTMTTPEGIMAILTSTDELDPLLTYYKQKAAGLGWTSKMEMKQTDHLLLMFAKDETELAVNVMRDDAAKQSIIHLTLSKKQ